MRLEDFHPDSSSYRKDYSICIPATALVNGSNSLDFWRVFLVGIN